MVKTLDINLQKKGVNLVKNEYQKFIPQTGAAAKTNVLQKLKNLVDKIDIASAILPIVPPLPTLAPIAGNIYGSEPADPTDCAAWPDSPFCGGNPFSTSAFSVEFSLVLDACNVGIQADVVLGFIKLPPVQIVWHSPAPECQYQEPPAQTQGYLTIGGHYAPVTNFQTISKVVRKIISVKQVGTFWFIQRREFNPPSDAINPFANSFIENAWEVKYLGCDGQIYPWYSYDSTYTHDYSQDPYWINRPLSQYESDIYYSNHHFKLYKAFDLQGNPVVLDKVLLSARGRAPFEPANPPFTCPSFVPPPPPPKAKMNCCDQVLAQLFVLNQKVNKLSEIVGVNQFPASFPKRLIYPNATGEEKIENLIEALAYQVRQVDKAVGYLPQKIKVADVNAAQPGNQSVEVNIHSFADFARETLQYLIDTEGDEDTLTNIAVRILYECGAIHQAVVQGDAMLDAITGYLDFKEKWKTIKVPFAFDPYAGQRGKKAGQGFGNQAQQKASKLPLTEEELEKLLPALLKEREVEIRVLENEQKRSQNDVLQEILRDARVAAAAVSDKADGKKLEALVDACQLMLQLQNAIDRNNVRKAMTSGDLRTRKKPK